MFKQYFEYRDGKLFWKAKTDPRSKMNIGDKAGYKNNEGYYRVKIFGKHHLAHRIIYEMFNGSISKEMQIDHINNNRSDNRIENLQLVTNVKNSQRRNQSKGYRIIKSNLTRPFKAHKKFNNKYYYLGYFGTACGAYMSNRMFFMGGV